MARIYYTNIDMKGNQLIEAVLEGRQDDPPVGTEETVAPLTADNTLTTADETDVSADQTVYQESQYGRIWFRTDDGSFRFMSVNAVRRLAETIGSDPIVAEARDAGIVRVSLDEPNLKSRIVAEMDGGGPDSYYVGQEVDDGTLDGGLSATTYLGGTANGSDPTEAAFTGGTADGGSA